MQGGGGCRSLGGEFRAWLDLLHVLNPCHFLSEIRRTLALGLRKHRPCTEVEIPKTGKRGFRKSLFFLWCPVEKWGFSDSNCPFSGWWKMGGFSAPKPSFLGLGDFDLCTGPARSLRAGFIGGCQKGGFPKGGFGGCSPGTKPERGYIRMFPQNENRNQGTFACSPGTKTGTRARSPKPPFYETALLSPVSLG